MSSASYKKHIFHGVGWRPQPNFITTEHTEYTEFFKGCCFGCSSQKVAPAPGTRDRSGVGVLTEIATGPVTPHFKPEP